MSSQHHAWCIACITWFACPHKSTHITCNTNKDDGKNNKMHVACILAKMHFAWPEQYSFPVPPCMQHCVAPPIWKERAKLYRGVRFGGQKGVGTQGTILEAQLFWTPEPSSILRMRCVGSDLAYSRCVQKSVSAELRMAEIGIAMHTNFQNKWQIWKELEWPHMKMVYMLGVPHVTASIRVAEVAKWP